MNNNSLVQRVAHHNDYAVYTRRKPRSRPHPLDDHLGSTQGFIEGLNAAARKFGSIRPIGHWGAYKYAIKMFSRITSERTLYRAWESLKGEAAGEDGVRPEEIRHYVAYRKWGTACRLYGRKMPAFRDTTFPGMSDVELFIVQILCDSKSVLTAYSVDFEARRWSQADLPSNNKLQKQQPHYRRNLDIKGFRGKTARSKPQNNPDDDGCRRQLFFELRQLFGNHLLSHNDAECNQLFVMAEQCGMAPGIIKTSLHIRYDEVMLAALLPRVGGDRTLLPELATIMAKGVAAKIERWHIDHAKSFILLVPVVDQLDRYYAEETEFIRNSLNWSAMRWIRDLLAQLPENGKGYRPGAIRRIPISKPDGGVRMLSVPPAVDRIVAKSALIVLQPVMEQVFLPSCVGCRNDRDRFDALATLADRYPASPGKWFLAADIRKAFDNVAHDRLMDVVSAYVPNKDVLTLLERSIRRPGFGNGIGLAQGDPLSPLFLNMLLHDYLDAPLDGFMKENGLVYFRYVDDICVFGLISRANGEEICGKIGALLRGIGLELHTQAPKTQIVNLASSSVEYNVDPGATGDCEIDRYLGLGLRGGKGGELEFFLPSSWEERLREMYANAERTIRMGGYAGKDGAHTHILHATQSWIHAFAPALQYENEDGTIARIIEICQSVSRHTSAMNPPELSKTWSKAREWWTRKYSET